jgi:hypothetical protein
LLTKDPTNENKAIMITYYDIEKFTINRKYTVTVVVGGSENSVVLDFNGMNRFSNALNRIEERRSNLIESAVLLDENNNNTFHQDGYVIKFIYCNVYYNIREILQWIIKI